MRIIGGTLKSRRLAAPRWEGLRPSSDRLRETLFNVLGDTVTDARVLDVFAGTGAVGLEALSRGAREVTFVERDSRAAALIEANAKALGLGGRLEIVRGAWPDAASRLAGPVDLVFFDPPYDDAVPAALLTSVEPLLRDGGICVIEHSKRLAVPERVGRLALRRDYRSGDSRLAVYDAGPADRAAP